MKPFDAWHLPGLQLDDSRIEEHQFGDALLRIPSLQVPDLTLAIATITEARDRVLANMPVADVVTALDHAARELASETSEEGAAARALLPTVTGYSSRTIEDVLLRMSRDWSRPSLEKLLQSELGDAAVLDHPVGGRFARGSRLGYHIFSGNVPGVAVTSIIRSLLVKSATFGKTASGEPVLPVLFARALARHAPELAGCLAVTYWPGGTEDLEAIVLAAAGTVVVYGGKEVVQSIGGRVSSHARLNVHGPKLSLGIVGRTASRTVSAAIARAVAAYDQQGCVSPHAVYVEAGGTTGAEQLAFDIAGQLAELAVSHPRRAIDPAEAAAIRAARTQAEFGRGSVFGSDDTSYTVIYDPDQNLAASCLNRTLYVKPISNVSEIPLILNPHRNLLQSVALAGFDDRQTNELAITLADCGVTRVCSFDDLPWPPMWWRHDGRGPLIELLSWQDINP